MKKPAQRMNVMPKFWRNMIHIMLFQYFFLILARERFSVQNVLDCTYDATMTHTKNFRFFYRKIDTKPAGELFSCARTDWLICYYDFRK